MSFDALGTQLFLAAGLVLILALLLLYILAVATKEEYVDPPYVPRHLRLTDDEVLAELDFDITVEITYEYLNPVQVGTHGHSSPVRNAHVASDWRPPIGNVRIALLETATAEYILARKPKDLEYAE